MPKFGIEEKKKFLFRPRLKPSKNPKEKPPTFQMWPKEKAFRAPASQLGSHTSGKNPNGLYRGGKERTSCVTVSGSSRLQQEGKTKKIHTMIII